MTPLRTQRVIVASVVTVVVIFFLYAALHSGSDPVRTLKELGHKANWYSTRPSYTKPIPPKVSFRDSIFSLYEPVRHPLTVEEYVDAYGTVYSMSNPPIWNQSLGRDILIVDIDTRDPDVFNPERMNWETLDSHKSGEMLSASFMNHYLYSQIHGYDYKFFKPKHISGHHDTWIKPHALYELLASNNYRFVVFIDADAVIQHLELPLEWLFNRWGISPNTSMAMPLDVQSTEGDDPKNSCDSKGKLVLNTGFMVAQALPYTFEMIDAWMTCTTEKRYPGCGNWKEKWSHEQRAFSEYIRYDFNPDGNNIVEIPCDDAMSFPGAFDTFDYIDSDCNGQFIRHFTVVKERVKESVDTALVQPMADLMQKAFVQNREDMWMSERR